MPFPRQHHKQCNAEPWALPFPQHHKHSSTAPLAVPSPQQHKHTHSCTDPWALHFPQHHKHSTVLWAVSTPPQHKHSSTLPWAVPCAGLPRSPSWSSSCWKKQAWAQVRVLKDRGEGWGDLRYRVKVCRPSMKSPLEQRLLEDAGLGSGVCIKGWYRVEA